MIEKDKAVCNHDADGNLNNKKHTQKSENYAAHLYLYVYTKLSFH